ncbi:MAG: sodium-translocating pyrophosphatase [archaeon]
MFDITTISVACSVLALIFAGYLAVKVKRESPGTPKMQELSTIIHDGAIAFLNKEYQPLVVFILIFAGVIYYFINPIMALALLIGAFSSALAGNIGMRIATSANARTANAAKKSIRDGLMVAFSSGAVMGLCVVGLGLLGVTGLYMYYGDTTILFGFGCGASAIALFARVGGGIYTKSADVGADLVGKVEAGIPEDDPRNPAVIADNVGDNVGDVAGMGADLFESYVDSIIAAMALGAIGAVAGAAVTPLLITLPLLLAAVGIISSILGTLIVLNLKGKNPAKLLNNGIFASAGIMLVLSGTLIWFLMGSLNIFFALLAGLAAGIIIGLSTEYYTSDHYAPTQGIAKAAKMGSATVIIEGLSVGMISTIIPVFAVSAAILTAFHFAGLYGIAIAAVGMLSTLGITLATDAYGPVADNAAGIAEMAKMGPAVRKRAEALDAVGNTTAAIGKGFAIGSAALTALALFATYSSVVGLEAINLINPVVVVGLFIGAFMPYLFSAFAMNAVGKAAMEMVEEVRRQFKQIKGLMEGKAQPDYKRCINISTSAALKQMILPSILAIISPILVGVVLGPEALGGMLAGVTASGFLMAVMMANSGGAWDNAKKYIESGKLGGKGSDAHKQAVVGDTVGDPFKDTAGPSLNILIKLMSIIALVFVPLFL